MTKTERIKNTLRKTRERRRSQRPVAFKMKLQNLSKKRVEIIERAFLEAKWLYNWLVSDPERLNLQTSKVSTVEVKVGDVFEQRQLTVLGSQVKQEIADRVKDNLTALSKLKQRGHTVGRLKPKKFVNSIPLKQYGVTYSLDCARNRVRIQKLGTFRVLGLHQLPADGEIASAVLVRKPSGYYLHVTCFLPRATAKSNRALPQKPSQPPPRLGEAVGVDFGVGTNLTLSNGLAIDCAVHETPRLKRLQRRLARAQKGSKNYERIRQRLRREYERLSNRRRDAQNKVLAFLRLYGKVAFQDDWVKGWAARFGRQVHAAGIGGLKSRLKNSLETPLLVARFEPTSQECAACGRRQKIPLSEQVFRCDCGWVCDRNLNAALVIKRKGLGLSPDQAVGLDRPELTPLEKETAARILGSTPHIRVRFLL